MIALAVQVSTCVGLKNIPTKQTNAKIEKTTTMSSCHIDANSIFFIMLFF